MHLEIQKTIQELKVFLQKINDLISIKKGVFTSCNSNKECPAWSIEAQEIKHDNKKTAYI